jgi:hypothetical protein
LVDAKNGEKEGAQGMLQAEERKAQDSYTLVELCFG